jgi:hypothetical protein
MPEPLLSPTFLFHFEVPFRHVAGLGSVDDIALGEEYRLPSFGELEGKPLFAEFRGGWSEAGIGFSCRVVGKAQTPWCRANRPDDSDGLQVWIDTRNGHNIHRATRFCHRFVFLPLGSGKRLDQPSAEMLPIHRSKESPKPVASKQLGVASQRNSDGYELRAFIPTTGLTGFDAEEHPRLGFSYAVIDRELGWQTFSIGPEFPIVDDPSLWGTLSLESA